MKPEMKIAIIIIIGSSILVIGVFIYSYYNRSTIDQYNGFIANLGIQVMAGLTADDFIKNKDLFLKNINKTDASFLVNLAQDQFATTADRQKALQILTKAGFPIPA